MTVSYSLKVSTCSLLTFAKLLFKWKGSIYQLVYKESILYAVCYYLVLIIYRFAMAGTQKVKFERFAQYCQKFTDAIPLTFVLGFYVTLIIERWWAQYSNLPWPDRVCYQIAAYVKGTDDNARMIRRTLARYLNLMACFTLQNISMKVKKRFPTLDHIEKAGLMTAAEKDALEKTSSPHGNWWFPATWFISLVNKASREGRIEEKFQLRLIIDEMILFRGNCGSLFGYDWISVPLVYTQVVTLATYTFFGACLFGRQYLQLKDDDGYQVEQFLPIYTLFQYFMYMGWLKVAEQLINPLGEDADDFETNYLIDRNINISYLIVDTLYDTFPGLEQDMHWNEAAPACLAYTTGTMDEVDKRQQIAPFLGSTADVEIKKEDQEIVPAATIEKAMSTTRLSNIGTSVLPVGSSMTNISNSSSKGSKYSPRQPPKMFQKLNRLISRQRSRATSGCSSIAGSKEAINQLPFENDSLLNDGGILNEPFDDIISLRSASSINFRPMSNNASPETVVRNASSRTSSASDLTTDDNNDNFKQPSSRMRTRPGSAFHDDMTRKILDTVVELDDTITSRSSRDDSLASRPTVLDSEIFQPPQQQTTTKEEDKSRNTDQPTNNPKV